MNWRCCRVHWPFAVLTPREAVSYFSALFEIAIEIYAEIEGERRREETRQETR